MPVSCEREYWVSSRNLIQPEEETETQTQTNLDVDFYPDTENGTNSNKGTLLKSKKKKSQVLLQGYVEGSNTDSDDDLNRKKSLTDDDLDELKGCLDLGFGFSYDEIPELCNTLPALELCYSMSQKFRDEQQKSPERSSPAVAEAVSSPIANWKISSPGDHPEDVKARLKFWAQTVACTVKLCS